MITVFGATGNVGSRVLARLVGSGHRVRAVGRSIGPLAEAVREHGAEPVVADLADLATLTGALEGCCARPAGSGRSCARAASPPTPSRGPPGRASGTRCAGSVPTSVAR